MDLGISGKVAMVAAASKGIGLAVATALAKEGCRVSICSRDAAALEAARRKILAEAPGAEVRIFPCDVMSGEDLEAWHRSVAAEMGPVDILVTNTGAALGEDRSLDVARRQAADRAADHLQHPARGTLRLDQDDVQRIRA